MKMHRHMIESSEGKRGTQGENGPEERFHIMVRYSQK